MRKLCGIGVSPGIALGRLHFLGNDPIQSEVTYCDDPVAELQRYYSAQRQACKELNSFYEQAIKRVGEKEAQIFSIHEMLVLDPDFMEEVERLISKNGLSAHSAVQRAGEAMASELAQVSDSTIRARAADIRDVTQRLVGILSDQTNDYEMTRSGESTGEAYILAAHDLLPSQTILLDKNNILATLTSEGSWNSHAAILSRMIGIPAVVGLKHQLQKQQEGALVIVDGQKGTVVIDPTPQDLEEYQQDKSRYNERQEQLQLLKDAPSTTRDGKAIEICANIASPSDLSQVEYWGAEGVGLFRTEFLYLGRTDFPTEEEQFQAYQTVLLGMGKRRTVIRTIDIGADKQLPYLNIPQEDNPAMGYRAIRICLDQFDLFETQLRALLRASVCGHLAVMFPMIDSLEEIRLIKQVVSRCMETLDAEKIPYSKDIEWGIMVETPAAVIISDLLAQEVDFFSIGTNDLTQYTLAVDRMNSKIASYYNEKHLAVLRSIHTVILNAHKHGIWTGICGELAAKIDSVPLLVAMGVDELSVAPSAVLQVREVVRNMDMAQMQKKILHILQG